MASYISKMVPEEIVVGELGVASAVQIPAVPLESRSDTILAFKT